MVTVKPIGSASRLLANPLITASLLLLVFVAPVAWGQQYETGTLLPASGQSGDFAGAAVAISGDAALVGAYGDQTHGNDSGAVYVFRRDAPSDMWQEEAKLLASDGAAVDKFGFSVALDGDRALVGAYLDDDNGADSGSAYVFGYDSVTGTWQEEAKLVSSDSMAYDFFGISVALDGDRALVGAYFDDDNGADSGAAYLFNYDSVSGTWQEEAKLVASDGAADDWFGFSAALSGDRALVSAHRDDDSGFNSGAAYIFAYDSVSGTWQEEAKLTAADGASYDYFGISVALSGEIALVGAEQDDDNGSGSGSAYLLRRDSVSGTWYEEAKLLASDGSGGDYFGGSVAIMSDRALVGASNDAAPYAGSGSAFVFRYHTPSGTWYEEAKLTASKGDYHDGFGSHVALSDDVALIGVPKDDDNGTNSGAALLVDFTSSLAIDVKCNGEDGDVIVDIGQNATVTIETKNGYHPGFMGDLWVIAITPFAPWTTWSYGPFYNPYWRPNANTVYYSGLGVNSYATVHDYPVPPGKYYVYLAVDAIPNGILNLHAIWYFDVVDFTVQ